MADNTITGSEGPTDPAGVDDGSMSRGKFLTQATIGVGAVIGGLITVPIAGMALAPAVKGGDFEPTSAGSIDDFPEGEFVKRVLDLGHGEPGGYVKERVAFIRKNADDFVDQVTGEKYDSGAKEYSVARNRRNANWTIVSNRCVHLGCPVQPTGSGFNCPCHGGQYGQDGQRTAGPPVRPLDRFEWKEDNGELIITGEYSLTNPKYKDAKKPAGDEPDLDKPAKPVDVHDPGQHTSGIQKLFYPLQP